MFQYLAKCYKRPKCKNDIFNTSRCSGDIRNVEPYENLTCRVVEGVSSDLYIKEYKRLIVSHFR